MAGPTITKCPKCDTSFRVTESQLRVAKGAVRCGACLNVFHALKHQISLNQKPSEHTKSISDEEIRFGDDDSGSSDFDFELDDAFLGLKRGQSISDPFEHSDEVTDSQDSDDEDWVKTLLEEDDADPEPLKRSKTPPSIEKPDTKSPQAGNPTTSKSAPLSVFNKAADTKPSKTQPSHIKAQKSHTLPPIEDEPLNLSNSTRKKSGLLWFFLSMTLGIALGAQYTFYNFNELSKVSEYRPYLEFLCQWTGCQLPSKIAVQKIKTTASPRVRKHPTKRNALIVDVLMINTATFLQPFPRIEILFSDHKQKPVASRAFMPGEYLKGELTGITLMPINKEIHVRFDILDPGSNATQYEVNFLPLNRPSTH